MSSTATILTSTRNALVVRVDHLDTDSFSRSVDRAAGKEWRTWAAARGIRTGYTWGKYAADGLGSGRNCVSIIAFTSDSFEFACALANSWSRTLRDLERDMSRV